jgi:hypothetical protein
MSGNFESKEGPTVCSREITVPSRRFALRLGPMLAVVLGSLPLLAFNSVGIAQKTGTNGDGKEMPRPHTYVVACQEPTTSTVQGELTHPCGTGDTGRVDYGDPNATGAPSYDLDCSADPTDAENQTVGSAGSGCTLKSDSSPCPKSGSPGSGPTNAQNYNPCQDLPTCDPQTTVGSSKNCTYPGATSSSTTSPGSAVPGSGSPGAIIDDACGTALIAAEKTCSALKKNKKPYNACLAQAQSRYKTCEAAPQLYLASVSRTPENIVAVDRTAPLETQCNQTLANNSQYCATRSDPKVQADCRAQTIGAHAACVQPISVAATKR